MRDEGFQGYDLRWLERLLVSPTGPPLCPGPPEAAPWARADSGKLGVKAECGQEGGHPAHMAGGPGGPVRCRG